MKKMDILILICGILICFQNQTMVSAVPLSEVEQTSSELHDGVEHTWSGWSGWSQCSVTCGQGLQERYRECIGVVGRKVIRLQNPRCPGHRVQYNTCNIEECHPGAADRRTYQCAQKNNQQVHGKKYQWTTFYGGNNPCELTCLAHGYSFFYNFGPVTDGTPCKREQNLEEDICVKGHCTRIGCDGHVGSNAVLDHCHKCNGHDRGCILHKNVYTRKKPAGGDVGYTSIVKVPKGSHYLRVDDTSNNYLAVADGKMNYIFNGNWVIDWPGTYQVAGTTIVYDRSFDGNETITATGPTREDLHIMLMFREQNPGISYGFRITSDKVHLIGEAQKKRTSWATTKVYERYQSHQPEYKSYQDGDSTEDKVTPQTLTRRVKPTSPSEIRTDKKSHTQNIIPTNSNKEMLERSTFHRDIFSRNPHFQKVNRKYSEDQFNIDGIQNEASVQSGKKSKKSARFHVKTSKRKPLPRDSSKKTNKITSVKDKCTPCRKPSDKLKQFCTSDFVIRAILLDYIFVGNYTRYEVRVVQAQKHTIPLLTREYLWTPGTKCRCPKLKISKEYFIMGNLVTDKKSRETKLQIDKHSFVRLFNKSNSKRLNSIPQSAKC